MSGLGEVSAFGLPGEVGVLVLDVPPGTAAAGLRRDDVIFMANGNAISVGADLIRNSMGPSPMTKRKVGIFRGQRVAEVEISGAVE